MKIINPLAAFAVSLALCACTGPVDPPPFEVSAIVDPAGGSTTSPRLATGPHDQLLLSWLQPAVDGVALRYARYENARWSSVNTVAESEHMFLNWADLPSVVPLDTDRLAAHWMVMSGAHSHAYDISFSESSDGGETWSAPIAPHTDGTDTEHGFVSIYDDDGATGLIWLDGRKMVNEVTDDPLASAMTLRSASITDDQNLANEQLVDEMICDCCQTDVAIASSGPVVVYRDRSVDEIRDIHVTRLIDDRWEAGVPVASDNWEIWGCPVNGPSIAADGNRVAVAWFTAAEEPLVNLAVSADSGASFSTPIEIIRSETVGRAAVALLDDGEVAVSWLVAAEPSNAAVKVRRIHRDGTVGPVRVVTNTASGLSVPQMVRHGSDLIFAWTEPAADGARIVSARVAIEGL